MSSDGLEGTGDDGSREPDINRDGRFVVFRSNSPEFPGARSVADTPVWQIYLADRATGYLKCLSLDSSGDAAANDCLAPAISSSGRYVTFSTKAANFDGADGTTQHVYRVDRGDRFLKRNQEGW